MTKTKIGTNKDFPLKFTELAVEKLISALEGEVKETFIKICLVGGGCSGYKESILFSTDSTDEDELETTLELDYKPHSALANEPYSLPANEALKVRVVTDSFSALYLAGTTIDFITKDFEEGFRFFAPENSTKKSCACGSSVAY